MSSAREQTWRVHSFDTSGKTLAECHHRKIEKSGRARAEEIRRGLFAVGMAFGLATEEPSAAFGFCTVRRMSC
jgi:hypothetical protein